MPPHLHPGKDQITAYHYFSGSTEIAERLWKAGFRDVNGRDSVGRTPLIVRPLHSPSRDWWDVCLIDFSLMQWLEFVTCILSKGANLYARQDVAFIKGQCGTKIPQDWQMLSTSAISFVAWKLGVAIAVQEMKRVPLQIKPIPVLPRDTLSRNTEQTLRSIVSDSTPDDCTCSCSEFGCTARSLIIRSYTRPTRMDTYLYRIRQYRIRDYGETIKRLAQFTDADAHSGSYEALRLLTFQELGLTHTCCDLRCKAGRDAHPGFCMLFGIEDQDNIHEIRANESAGLSQLEELLTEFELKMDELDVSFPDFLTDYWGPRMKQVVDENEGYLDMVGIRKLGVKIDEPYSDPMFCT